MGHHHRWDAGVERRAEPGTSSRVEILERRVVHDRSVVAVSQLALAGKVLGRGQHPSPTQPVGEGAGAQPRLAGSHRKGPVADGSTGRSAIGVDHWRQDEIETELVQDGTALGGDSGDLVQWTLAQGTRRRRGADDGAQPRHAPTLFVHTGEKTARRPLAQPVEQGPGLRPVGDVGAEQDHAPQPQLGDLGSHGVVGRGGVTDPDGQHRRRPYLEGRRTARGGHRSRCR